MDGTVTEAQVVASFPPGTPITQVRLMRNKETGTAAGYGFVEFTTRDAAERVLETCNGLPIVGAGRCLRLNRAQRGAPGALTSAPSASPHQPPPHHHPREAEYSVFASALGPEVTDAMLFAHFAAQYGTMAVTSAKVITDATTGASRGFGFVRFSDEATRNKAVEQMAGSMLNGRPIRTSVAQPRGSAQAAAAAAAAQQQQVPMAYAQMPALPLATAMQMPLGGMMLPMMMMPTPPTVPTTPMPQQ
jgi:RNA recognition motif-containing protein